MSKNSDEMKVCGFNACQMLYKKRPQSIIRAYVTESRMKQFTQMLKFCAQNKKAYRVISEEEMNKVTESTHHEGVCLLVKKLPIQSDMEFLNKKTSVPPKSSYVVALENVENPHNIGSILRVCANFGADALLLNHGKNAQSAAVYRTAEGGAEWVSILETKDFVQSIGAFQKAGYQVVSTSSHVGKPLYKEKFSKKILLVLGSEANGVSSEVMRSSNVCVSIPSTGNVESLNVACAAGIVLSCFYGKS